MDIENELAELDAKEYQRLKRVIARNKSELRGLSEKEKLKLLSGWINNIKEERIRKAEEAKELEEYEAEAEEEKAAEIGESAETAPEIDVIEDEEAEKKKGGWLKAIVAIAILLIIIAACVIFMIYLLKDNGDVRFNGIGNKVIDENERLEIKFITKNADGINIYGIPNGSRFNHTTFIWTPAYWQQGIYNITATAYNNQSNKTQSFRIKVNNVNSVPRLIYTSPPQKIGVYIGRKVSFKAIAEDKDKDHLTYTWYFGSEKYSGGTEMNRTFTVPGDKTVKVVVCDNDDCASYAWNVKVVSYIPQAQTRTYTITEITVRNETIAEEVGGEDGGVPMKTYSVSDSGDEEVVIIPNAESNENILNRYVIEG